MTKVRVGLAAFAIAASLIVGTAHPEAAADGDSLPVLRFTPGTSRLEPGPGGQEGLRRVAAFLAGHPKVTKLRIAAHASNAGTPTSTLDLTVARARTVREALVAMGIERRRLVAVAFGQNQPVANNATPAGQAQNERVEFWIAEQDGHPLGDVSGGGMVVADAEPSGGGAPPPPAASKGCPTPDYPVALSQVRGVVLDPSSDGPVSTEGGFTAAVVRRRASSLLEAAGMQVFRTQDEAHKAKVYAPWLTMNVYSLGATVQGPPYFYMVEARLADATTLSDGSRTNVTVWSKSEFGSCDGPKLVPHVNELMDKIVAQFVAAVRAARAKK